jgi:hypothetical protein
LLQVSTMGSADDLRRELDQPVRAGEAPPTKVRTVRIELDRVAVVRDTHGLPPGGNHHVTDNGWRLAVHASHSSKQTAADVRVELKRALEMIASTPPIAWKTNSLTNAQSRPATSCINAAAHRCRTFSLLPYSPCSGTGHGRSRTLKMRPCLGRSRAWIYRGHVVATEDPDGHGEIALKEREAVESLLAAEPPALQAELDALQERLLADRDADDPATHEALERLLAGELLLGDEAQHLLAWKGATPQEQRRGRQHIPREMRLAVWQRDGGRCVECETDFDLQYDHIIPVAMGGATSIPNLQLLCGTCNRRKAATFG